MEWFIKFSSMILNSPFESIFGWQNFVLLVNIISKIIFVFVLYFLLKKFVVFNSGYSNKNRFYILIGILVFLFSIVQLLSIYNIWSFNLLIEGVYSVLTTILLIMMLIVVKPIIPRLDTYNLNILNQFKENQDLLNTVIENIPTGILMADSSGKITLVNFALEKMFGYEKNELIGKFVEDLIPKSYRKSHVEYRLNYIKNPHNRQMGAGRDLNGIKKDGSEIPVEIGLSPLKSTNVIASIIDISERRKTEEKILKEHFVLSQVLELNTDGWWNLDLKNSNNDYLSPSFKKLFGYEEHELGNNTKTWKQIIFPEDLEVALNNLNKHLETNGKHPYYQKVRYYHKNGKTIWVICKGVALKDDYGNWDKMIGVHFDITNLMELENSLTNTNFELEQKNKELEQFVYSVSHDLKSPLVTSSGFLGFLESDIKKKDYEKVQDSIDRLKKANSRMKQLIDDLLELSRIGKIKLLKENVIYEGVIENIIDNLKSKINEADVSIEVDSNMTKVYCDKNRLYQILENLIVNAIKYGINSKSRKILIGSEEDLNFVKIYVKDFGQGIEKKYHEDIFGLFQRLDKNNLNGNGIGLAIVSRIMNLHKGRVWVESELGKGATFWLEFPKF